MKQRVLRFLLYLAGKLGGTLSTDSGDQRLILNLELQIAELRADRDLYRDLVLQEFPHREELPTPSAEASEPSEPQAGVIQVRDWKSARRIRARAARDKRDHKEDPVHREPAS